MPNLQSLYFMNDFKTSNWPTILPVLTPTESNAVVFPDLQEVVFLVDANCKQECTDELYNVLRDFVLMRKGTLTRLSIPPVQNMDILSPLRSLITVHFTHISFSFVSLFHSGVRTFSGFHPLPFYSCSQPISTNVVEWKVHA